MSVPSVALAVPPASRAAPKLGQPVPQTNRPFVALRATSLGDFCTSKARRDQDAAEAARLVGIVTTNSPEAADILTCSECGAAVPEESSTGPRLPCPKCGSTKRTIGLRTVLAANATVTARPTAGSYANVLLGTARKFTKDNHHGIAVVVAHMACEVAVERAMRRAFTTNDVSALARPVLDLLNGYNLGNDRTRKLYAALTNDDIAAQPFWSRFKASSERRNKIIHRGSLATAEEAQESIDAVSALLKHLAAREPALD